MGFLSEKYPYVKAITLTVHEMGVLGRPGIPVRNEDRVRDYDLESLPRHQRCKNPDCRGDAAGLRLDLALLTAVRSRDPNVDEMVECRGRETSGRCPNFFGVKGAIEYENEDEES